MVNTDLVSYCRIDLPSSHPGDDLWQNKQPFGPSSLSAVTLSMEICGLNQRSDDTQPSVVVLSVFGHEVERKHTIADFFFSIKKKKSKKNTKQIQMRAHTQCVVAVPHKHMYTITDAHTGATTHTETRAHTHLLPRSPESPILK